MLKREYAKLGWHKKNIISQAYESGIWGWYLCDNQHIRRLVEWGYFAHKGEWGYYELTPEGKQAYLLQHE